MKKVKNAYYAYKSSYQKKHTLVQASILIFIKTSADSVAYLYIPALGACFIVLIILKEIMIPVT